MKKGSEKSASSDGSLRKVKLLFTSSPSSCPEKQTNINFNIINLMLIIDITYKLFRFLNKKNTEMKQ